eukprot:Amastigsp_a518807_14.p2 type:complete len:139 gc:universal Amastigsp_a518807_14:3-419(+)
MGTLESCRHWSSCNANIVCCCARRGSLARANQRRRSRRERPGAVCSELRRLLCSRVACSRDVSASRRRCSRLWKCARVSATSRRLVGGQDQDLWVHQRSGDGASHRAGLRRHIPDSSRALRSRDGDSRGANHAPPQRP